MLTDPSGNPVPEDDPRIPRPSQIAKEREAANLLRDTVRESIPGARIQEAELAARVDALISLLVPPDGPTRAIFEFRVEENRGANFVRILEAWRAAKAEAERPRLVVPDVVTRPT